MVQKQLHLVPSNLRRLYARELHAISGKQDAALLVDKTLPTVTSMMVHTPPSRSVDGSRPMAAAVASDMSAAAHPAASSQCGRQARTVAGGRASTCSGLGSRLRTRACARTYVTQFNLDYVAVQPWSTTEAPHHFDRVGSIRSPDGEMLVRFAWGHVEAALCSGARPQRQPHFLLPTI